MEFVCSAVIYYVHYVSLWCFFLFIYFFKYCVKTLCCRNILG